jgi:DNA-binding transcriptional regulator YdaS (Cro superfamily)
MIEHDAMLSKIIAEVGSRAALGRLLGISRIAVSRWDKVPVKHVLTIENSLGRKEFSRYKVRPDVYPRD